LRRRGFSRQLRAQGNEEPRTTLREFELANRVGTGTVDPDLADRVRCVKLVVSLAKQWASQPILSRFLSHDPDQHRDIRLETTADKLCAYFGLELRPADKPKGKDKVKAPAMPAVDWAAAEPKTKPKDEGRERRK